VVNKQDTVSAEQRREVLAFVAERLERLSFPEAPRIFSLSARQGLRARQSGDGLKLDESGLVSFEAELLRFLTEERAQSFLLNLHDRAADLLAQRSRPQGQAAREEACHLNYA
jgi:hypothetical protein